MTDAATILERHLRIMACGFSPTPSRSVWEAQLGSLQKQRSSHFTVRDLEVHHSTVTQANETSQSKYRFPVSLVWPPVLSSGRVEKA